MAPPENISIATYLFKRLHELGVRGVHGVPASPLLYLHYPIN